MKNRDEIVIVRGEPIEDLPEPCYYRARVESLIAHGLLGLYKGKGIAAVYLVCPLEFRWKSENWIRHTGVSRFLCVDTGEDELIWLDTYPRRFEYVPKELSHLDHL